MLRKGARSFLPCFTASTRAPSSSLVSPFTRARASATASMPVASPTGGLSLTGRRPPSLRGQCWPTRRDRPRLETLRTWMPPAPLPGSPFAKVYTKLAQRYLAARDAQSARRPRPARGTASSRLRFLLRRAAPGLRGTRTPLAAAPRAVPARVFSSALFARRAKASIGRSMTSDSDAWDFALRAVLIALQARNEDGVVALERELARPVWDHVLEKLGTQDATPRESASGPCARAGYREATSASRLCPAGPSRAASPRSGRRTPSKRSTRGVVAARRDIARVAMCSWRALRGTVTLGPPQGHELLRLLAQHPRAPPERRKADPDDDPARRSHRGRPHDAHGRGTRRRPHAAFHWSIGRPLDASMLNGVESTGLRGAVRGATIASVFVPPALRPWLDAAQTVGSAMAFPTESVPKLVNATQALLRRSRRAPARCARRRAPDTTRGLRCASSGSPRRRRVVEIFVSRAPARAARRRRAGPGALHVPIRTAGASSSSAISRARDARSSPRTRAARSPRPSAGTACRAHRGPRGHARARRVPRSQPARARRSR